MSYRNPGLGTVGAPTNVQPINGYGNKTDKFSLFISNIPPSIDDFWLSKMFECVGHLLKLNRPKDASGVPRAFGFADYGDAESVLRCIEVLHNIRLDGDKRLGVKADERTKQRLDIYESQRVRSDADEEALQEAQNKLQAVMEEMRELGPQQTDAERMEAARKAADRQRFMPSHLQDLAPEDLPPEQRGLITKEIAFFREQAAKREADKRARQVAAETRRAPSDRPAPSPRDDFRRDYRRDDDQRGGSRPSDAPPQGRQRQWGAPARDAQPAFVRSSDERNGRSGYDGDDEEQERRRQERIKRDAEAAFRDRERRWENKERARVSGLERDKLREEGLQRDEEAQRVAMATKLATWDDEVERDKGKELFHVDRNRWRAQRKGFRQREIDADKRDAEQEAKELEQLSKRSEAFLDSQADFLSEMAAKPKSKNAASALSGASLDETTHIKLSVVKEKQKEKKEEATKAQSNLAPSAAFAGSIEEEAEQNKKRELIPLNYSDDELEDEEELGMTNEQKLQRRQEKIKSLVASIPTDKNGLWMWEVRWDKLTENIIEQKIRPFVIKKVVEAVGSEEEELVNACLDVIRAHKSAQDLADEVEPVLADEADDFVIKIWRFLIFELLARMHRIPTTTA